MQLKHIKVSGFKSFADPTLIPFKSQLTAIVGPNGCGKSNVVDAIRCVLSGAAKQLRGGTMPDVIFNGSANRKPVGQASVELVFDNSDGIIGGEYAAYPEISIRREINRDGTSDYWLNGIRCRRRDVVDIFLGTGLGPQSYAIIEQGMITRMIEAKPEELRMHLEEVAGISKYKERRRETENRIQHTRENLDRLTDHRIELDKQLAHLKRQANAAERYKELKQEERTVKAELQAIHWQQLQQQITEQDNLIKEEENRHEAKVAELRQLEAEIEKLRQQKITETDIFNEVQSRFYGLGAEIARLEQTVKNARERRQQLQTDLARLEQSSQETQRSYEEDQIQAEELNTDLLRLEPEIELAKTAAEKAQQQLLLAEKNMQDWQSHWDNFNQRAASTARAIEVEQTHKQHLEQFIADAGQRIHRIETERNQFDFAQMNSEIQTFHAQHEDLKKQQENWQNNLDNIKQQLQQQREAEQQQVTQLDQARNQLQHLNGRRSSLEALQQAALGKTDQVVTGWLQQQHLEQQPRLAESLQVEDGWELAVETVLGPYLEAVCVNDIAEFSAALQQFPKGQLSLVRFEQQATSSDKQNTLANKIKSKWSLSDFLTGIYVAENLTEALQLTLSTKESVVTKDGIWLGNHWLRIARPTDAKAGVIQRERELQELHQLIAQQQKTIANHEETLAEIKNALTQLQQQQQHTQEQYLQCAAKASDLQAQLKAKQVRLEQLQQREIAVTKELAENQQQLTEAKQKLANAQTTLQQSLGSLASDNKQREELQQQREIFRQQLDQTRLTARTAKETVDELSMSLESSRNQTHYVRQAMARAEKQLLDINERRAQITNQLTEIEAPLQQTSQELEKILQDRLNVERELEIARQKLNHVDHALREQEKMRTALNDVIAETRNQLEQARMHLQALQIRQANHLEKIAEIDYELPTLLQQLNANPFSIPEWEEKINRIENRIQRLGPINLAAIDEYQTILERKNYLDAQNNDLVEAMTTLENAIRKIDRETRDRLQETYDKVNQEFNALFQQIFNGGHASLELTEADLLNTGVIVKAQPPGKRNTTIHLLSGGEKALTATALVFALFRLNPAPFCILDEVDAPLDDMNVGRFCALVKEMSKKVQFIFISHNKLSIEIADQLIGVTMNEPGVSRLVAVDVAQAIEMAAN